MALSIVQPLRSSNNPTAAGALFIARNTGRLLFVLRSPDSIEPNTWCGVGGGIEMGESPIEACRREVSEEIGDVGEYDLFPTLISEYPGLTFYNFIGIVDEEFTPTLNDEHTDYLWVDFNAWPNPLHPGATALVNDSGARAMIQHLLVESRVTAVSESERRAALRLTIRKQKDAAEKRADTMRKQVEDSLQRDKVGKRK